MPIAETHSDKHVIVFAKAPRLGRVKTRLARDIGTLGAWRFYRHNLAVLLNRLNGDPRWRTHLALTPDRAAQAPPDPLWPDALSTLTQGNGDLGARMARAFRRSLPGRVVIVGADIPGVRRRHIARAFAALGEADMVFGPSGDGGYWLVGARGSVRHASLFAGVRWSSGHELADSIASAPRGARIDLVDELKDIDTGADWRDWRRGRRGEENP